MPLPNFGPGESMCPAESKSRPAEKTPSASRSSFEMRAQPLHRDAGVMFSFGVFGGFEGCSLMRGEGEYHANAPLGRSEEHTSELQSRGHLVCRLLLEKKNQPTMYLHIRNKYEPIRITLA